MILPPCRVRPAVTSARSPFSPIISSISSNAGDRILNVFDKRHSSSSVHRRISGSVSGRISVSPA